jgi:hypothetical protein
MTDDFEKLSEIIEGAEFRFLANQAAGLSMFRRIVESQEDFQALVKLAATKEGGLAIYERMAALVASETETAYEHLDDTALAAYLLALDLAQSDYAPGSAALLSSLANLWWSKRVADEVLSSSSAHTPESYETARIPLEVPAKPADH